MSACNGGSSVCTESVHATACHCARVALVITVGPGAHVRAVKQLNEHQVIHARRNNTGLDLCPARLVCELQVQSRWYFKTTLKIMVSSVNAYPSIQVAVKNHGRVSFDTPTTVRTTTRSLERDK